MSNKIKEKKSKLSKDEKSQLKLDARNERIKLLEEKEKKVSRKVLFKKVTISVIMVVLLVSMCLPYLAGIL